MKRTILDTSFILTCVRQKIDFFEELGFLGLKPIVPEQVMEEIKSMKKSEAETALKIIRDFKPETIDLKTKDVDKGLIKLVEDNKEMFIATLDREIKNNFKGRVILIRGKKKLEII